MYLFLHDSGVLEEERILIFGTLENIQHLKYSKIWVCDGTFAAVPKPFSQLFTIQRFIRGKFFPLIFCMMKKRNVLFYEKLFTFLLMQNTELNPVSIILDFGRLRMSH